MMMRVPAREVPQPNLNRNGNVRDVCAGAHLVFSGDDSFSIRLVSFIVNR